MVTRRSNNKPGTSRPSKLNISHKTLIFTSLTLFFIFNTGSILSQDYFSLDQLRYDDQEYDQSIKTVQLYPEGNEIGYPFLKLGSESKLILEFDDLKSRGINYAYTLILCNADWSPADIDVIDYIEGYSEEFFSEAQLSYNTTTTYAHYKTSLPSKNMKITKSGNYLLKVYEEGNEDAPLITRRLYVYEENIEIEASAAKATKPEDYLDKHELQLKVNLGTTQVGNIYEELKIIVQQNGRKDNIKQLLAPNSINNSVLTYGKPGEIVFEATNEFRKLDIRSLKVQSANAFTTLFTKNGYEVSMLPESFRMSYLFYADIQGQFAIINWDDTHISHSIEADYVWVDFTLSMPQPIDTGGIYLIGGMTNWKPTSKSRMVYDSASKSYKLRMLLKQGYYEYQYLVYQSTQKQGSTNMTENNFSDTKNNYNIFVYQRGSSDRYERLLGIKSITNN